jgi:hypothetical protein
MLVSIISIICSDRMNHSSVVSVGIDVGKAKLDVACVREDRSAIHQVFSNTKKKEPILSRSSLNSKGRLSPSLACLKRPEIIISSQV